MTRDAGPGGIRERLLREGVASLLAGGYNGTGLKQVLDRVQVPKGSFYNYFESKEQFGAEVIRHYARGCWRSLDEAVAAHGDAPVDGLRSYFEAEIQRHRRGGRGCLVGNLGAELGDSPVLCRQALREAMEGLRSRFAAALERAQRLGQVRDDRPAGELAGFLLDAWEGALIRMKVEGSGEPLRKCCSYVLDELLRPGVRQRETMSGPGHAPADADGTGPPGAPSGRNR